MRSFRNRSERTNIGDLVRLSFAFLIFTAASFAQLPAASLPAVRPDMDAATSKVAEPPKTNDDFRVEKVPVAGGADLLTIIARSQDPATKKNLDIPLVSILRDTLGDDSPENDRLRYVWMLSYTKGSLSQQIAAGIPFLYSRTTNKNDVGKGPPPPIFDMNAGDKGKLNRAFRIIFNKFILGQFSYAVRASVLQYQRNSADHRRTAVAKALAVLALYQAEQKGTESLLNEAELKDVQARLWLMDKLLGWHMASENLDRVYEKELAHTRDVRNQNWELLRQYSEAQGLYFDPLEMSDGSARHAIVWADAADIKANRDKKFDRRFLNIKSPWNDPELLNWKGYSQVRWFDEQDREVPADTPNAKPRTLIPLAVYGLDFPKIPALLVDFRNSSNVKLREMSRRLVDDIAFNVLAVGFFSNLPYTAGRMTYDYVTGKRGMDLNQSSRLKSYSQLKLLLSIDPSMDPGLRSAIEKRIEHATLNPLENDLAVEEKLARTQYENLIAYAQRPDGLPAQLDKDRREEMVRLVHSSKDRYLYSAAHFLSFGLFTKREKSTPDLIAKMDMRRQLDYHERYLAEVAATSSKPEVDSNFDEVKRSMQFISQNGSAAKGKTVRAVARIFAITGDEDMRRLCVAGLYRINDSGAKKQLLAIYGNSNVTEKWRNMCAHYLKLALEEGQQISSRDAQTIAGIEAN